MNQASTPKRLSDLELKMLAWGIRDLCEKDSDCWKLATEILLRLGAKIP